MVLMMVIPWAVICVIRKLMENMDPEAMKEFRQQQADAQRQLQQGGGLTALLTGQQAKR